MNRISNYVSALRWRQMLSLRKAPYHALIQLCGKDGMGKTTIARTYTAEEEGFYFSFRHLESTLALQAFMPGCADWDTFFTKLKRKSNHPTIVFDDVDDRNDKDDFKNALYRHLTERTTVILVLRKEGSGFRYDEAIEVHRMTAYDIRNLFPTLSPQEVLRLLALTDGYPQLVNAHQEELSFEENVQQFFTEGSAFLEYAPIWLRQEFRSPESYNALLYAMATGHNRVSQIAAFTGYPKNKCDKYLNALADANFVTKCTRREASGSLRTYYHPASSYLKLWYGIYLPNRSRFLDAPPKKLLKEVLAQLQTTLPMEECRKACLRWIYINQFDLASDVLHPNDPMLYDIDVGGFTFDFVQVNGERIVFASLWDDIETPFPIERFRQLDKASCGMNPFYHNTYILFSAAGFPDSLKKFGGQYENVYLLDFKTLTRNKTVSEVWI